MTRMYGPAVRCKRFLSIRQMWSCINVYDLCLERVVLRAIMDISAPATSLAVRPERAIWVTSFHRRRKDRPPSRLIISQTSAARHRILASAVPSDNPELTNTFFGGSRSATETVGVANVCEHPRRRELHLLYFDHLDCDHRLNQAARMPMPTPASWNTAIVQAAGMLVACMALFGLVYRLFRQELLDQMTDIKLRLRGPPRGGKGSKTA
jgi:hypothetical protein